MIDPKLITFLTVLEEKTYLKAAEKLYVSQPSVTYHIKNLEKEYGITLFKNNRDLELTEEGKVLYEYAKNCLIEDEELINNFKKKGDNVVLEIAFTNMLSDMKNLSNIFDFASSNDLYFNCRCDHYNKIVDELKNGKIDFGIIDHNFTEDKLESISLLQNKIILVAKIDGKYAEYNRITRDMLQQATLVLGPTYSGLYDATMQAFKNKNIRLKNKKILTASTSSLIVNLVESYDGIGFVYENCVIDKILNGSLKRIELMNYEPYQNVYLVYSKNASEYTKKQIIIDRYKKNKEA
ncbi:MAG: LysR family transcriptional regulator [Acholeplasmatales bacterium]|nr:LysR family transcriptional regulator [Acholeplasmatales bacterium]